MKAFTETTMTKKEMVTALKWHQEQDNFVKGRYFREGKGCAVGCSLESVAMLKNIPIDGHANHKDYEVHFGVPEWLAMVEDTLFEGLPIARSKSWPLEFIEAINVGSDLDTIKAPFTIFVLESNLENFDNDKYPEVVAVINRCIALYKKYPNGPTESAAWAAARSAAESAARSATWAATRSSAWASAWAAAESAARSAAGSATYIKFADELLRLIKECK